MTSAGERHALSKLIGNAPVFVSVLQALPKLAKSNATVLVMGETGTGKELAARAIHYLSPRAGFPFVAINCGALSDTLLEEELFGHERGAFTDAHRQRSGLVAQAEKGTLFLDEIDALGPKGQVCLLRLLQEKTYRRIGAAAESRADVRVIAATNARLDDPAERRCLREDLYYRICILFVLMPPLRERVEDILPLARHFLRKHSPPERGDLMLSEEAQARLPQHSWPGNIRELENLTVRAIYTSDAAVLTAEDFGFRREGMVHPAAAAAGHNGEKLAGFKQMKKQAVDHFERQYLERLMSEHLGNVSQAAKFAGKERRDLGKLLKKHGLSARSFYMGDGEGGCSLPHPGETHPPQNAEIARKGVSWAGDGRPTPRADLA